MKKHRITITTEEARIIVLALKAVVWKALLPEQNTAPVERLNNRMQKLAELDTPTRVGDTTP